MAGQGPDSFVPDARVNYSQAQAAAPLQIKNTAPAAANPSAAQFRGGSVNFIGAQAQQTDPGVMQQNANYNATGNWLLKAAGEQIAPYVQAYTESLAMDGIRQVASGKAIQEIIDQQPWYSRMFGDSDLISTSRAYTAQKQVSQFTAQATRDLAGMVTSSPDEVQQYMLKAMQNFQTGDTLTDAVTNQEMIKASSDLFAQWTKANYKTMQLQTRQAQKGSWVEMGNAYDAQAKAHLVDGTVSSDTMNVSTQQLIAGMGIVKGQDPTAYADNVTDTVKELAMGGKFHAITAVATSGLLKVLPTDKQAELASFVRTQETRVQSEVMSTTYAEGIQNLMFQIKTLNKSPAEVAKQVMLLNDQAAREYGFQNPMITPKQMQAWMGDATDLSATFVNRQAAIKQQEAIEAARKSGNEAATATLETTKTAEAVSQFSAGGRIPVESDKQRLQTVAPTTYNDMEAKNPGSGMKSLVGLYINNGSGGIMTTLREQFNAPLRMASQTGWTPQFDQQVLPTFNAMTALPGGRDAAVAYYGENYERIRSYQAMLNSHTPPDLAYNAAFVQPTILGDVSKLTQNQRDDLNSAIDEQYKATFGGSDFTELNDAGRAIVMNRAQANLVRIQNRAGLDDAEKYNESVRMALNDGSLALYGEYAWPRNPENKPIHEQIGVTNQQLYGLLRKTLENEKSLEGMNLDGAQFVEQNDGKHSQLMVYVRDGGQKYHTAIVTSEELTALQKKLIAEKQEWQILYRTSAKTATRQLY